MTFLYELLIIIGTLVLIVVIAIGAAAVLGIMGRKEDTKFLKEAEEKSNRKADESK